MSARVTVAMSVAICVASAFACGEARADDKARTYRGWGETAPPASDVANIEAARAISIGHPYDCPDPSTRRMSEEDAQRRVDEWREAIPISFTKINPKYQSIKMAYRAPLIGVPRRFKRAGVSAGVMMLLLVERDGTVADVLVICSTDDEFSSYAEKAAYKNRYHPASSDGKPLRSAGFLPYFFSGD